jgi:hypothetical protein
MDKINFRILLAHAILNTTASLFVTTYFYRDILLFFNMFFSYVLAFTKTTILNLNV